MQWKQNWLFHVKPRDKDQSSLLKCLQNTNNLCKKRYNLISPHWLSWSRGGYVAYEIRVVWLRKKRHVFSQTKNWNLARSIWIAGLQHKLKKNHHFVVTGSIVTILKPRQTTFNASNLWRNQKLLLANWPIMKRNLLTYIRVFGVLI